MTSSTARTAVARRAAVGAPRRVRSLERSKRQAGLVSVLPAVILVMAFVLFPLGFAVYISMTDWPLIGDVHFVGLANYIDLLHDVAFRRSILFTLLYTAIVTGPVFVVGYLLAMIVRTNRRGASVFRVLLFLPYVVGLTAVSFMMLLELQPGAGVVNFILKTLRLTNGDTAWLGSASSSLLMISIMVVWLASGLTMLLLVGGMQGIDKDIYEAAEMDGAGFWTRELRITVPLLRNAIAMSLILSIIASFLAFNQFYILTQGGPGTSTTSVLYAIYNRAFVQLSVGSATAMSLVLVVVIAAITALQFLVLRDDAGDRPRRRLWKRDAS